MKADQAVPKRSSLTRADIFQSLVRNALDFLTFAISEFESKPKSSMVDFYTAVELFLKARLLREHWSLIVVKDADWKSFVSGDFQSVPFNEACNRLEKVVQSGLAATAKKKFDAIRRHRNRMVHFFHEVDSADPRANENVAIEQLGAWHELRRLLTIQWNPIFKGFTYDFDRIESQLRHHREYLGTKYETLAVEIAALKDSGIAVSECTYCHFAAAPTEHVIGLVRHAKCLVCESDSNWIDYNCDACGRVSPLEQGGEFKCPHCKNSESERRIYEKLDQSEYGSDDLDHSDDGPYDYVDADVPGNCSECEGYHTVCEYEGKYLCINCFEVDDNMERCLWCNEANNGDMRDSYGKGCSLCAGKVGEMDE
jgi:hypothetical protein